jgi:3-phosphoshikimate 1-carboxyvinyltransferase
VKRSVHPAKALAGTVAPPSDKSISHRAAILNGMVPGEAVVDNFSDGGDCRSTLRCLQALGVSVEQIAHPDGSTAPPRLRIKSPGLTGLAEPQDVLNSGNSGTTMRLLIGLLAGAQFVSVVTGDRSLRSRPMGRIVQPLSLMGAHIMGRNGDSLAPLTVRGGGLKGIEYTIPVASAQLKSSLVLAALFAQGETVLHQPAHSRDHTERMLEAMGASFTEDELVLVVKPGSQLKPLNVKVAGDISSAAFWMVAAAAHPRAQVKLTNVGVNPTRTGVLDVLEAMGAKITKENPRMEGGEPVADLRIESSDLRGVEIGGDLIPRAIDEIPVLALAACFARGTTVIRDAEELRFKESDRLRGTARELSRLGARIRELPDGLSIEGTGSLKGGTCRSYGDHRMAMTLGIAGLLATEEVVVGDSETVGVSYPTFWQDMYSLTSV